MTDTLSLLKLAEEKDILVTFLPLHNRALAIRLDDQKCAIAINRRWRGNRREKKACLAHELGHCETGSFYNVHSSLELRSRYESRADRWAIKRLIPRDELVRAVRSGLREIWQLAEHFDVPYDFMQKAIDYYKCPRI